MYGLDLFSGIGGITKALEGYVTPVAYCENDRYAQAVLLSRMSTRTIPYAPIWDDVSTLRGISLPIHPEIIYGGFPCQDISIAGRGSGLAGKRSGLFFEIVRLVSEIRPRFVFLENVPAIRMRGGDVVAGELARLGYDCRWDALSAADVGANHRRERWWLLAHAECSERWPLTEKRNEPDGCDAGRKETPGGTGERREAVAHAKGRGSGRISCVAAAGLAGIGCSSKDMADSEGDARRISNGNGKDDVSDAHSVCGTTTGGTRTRRPESSDRGWWDIEPNVCGMADGLFEELDDSGHVGITKEKREKLDARLLCGQEDSHGEQRREMRPLWEEFITGRSSCGRQSTEQLADEFTDALRQMPHAPALGDRETTLAKARSYLLGLQQAIATLRPMPHSPISLIEAWQSLSEEEKNWASVAIRRGLWAQEWPGVLRVATGIKSRVDRLRALGNAVVPAQAREAFERLMGVK